MLLQNVQNIQSKILVIQNSQTNDCDAENRVNPLHLYDQTYLANCNPEQAARFILDHIRSWIPNSTFSVLPDKGKKVSQKIIDMREQYGYFQDKSITPSDFKFATAAAAKRGYGNCFEAALLSARILIECGYPHSIEIHSVTGQVLGEDQLDHIYLRILGPGGSICVDPTAHTLHEFYKNRLNLPEHYFAYGPMSDFKSIIIPWACSPNGDIRPVQLHEADKILSLYRTTVIKGDNGVVTVSEQVRASL